MLDVVEQSVDPAERLISAAAEAAQYWLFNKALPLWADRGVDARGAFVERLTAGGEADTAADRRMRVQARQLYVFSEAACFGWAGTALPIVERGFDTFVRTCWAPDGGTGWIHILRPDGSVLDARRDTYDQAFALFALAAVHRATGDPRARSLAEQTLFWLESTLHDPVNGGFLEGAPASLPRRSNPHMHLLEAFLAWYEATGDMEWLRQASAIVNLFRGRLYDPETGTLGEFFKQNWGPAPGKAGRSVEPGHHFEWAWLLERASRLGAGDALAEAAALYEFGLRYGRDAKGMVIDECDRDGTHRRASRRLWPQTELIKAHVALARCGDLRAEDSIAPAYQALAHNYLDVAPSGAWVDQYDDQGRLISDGAPASTLYHILIAQLELIGFVQFRRRRRAQAGPDQAAPGAAD